MRTSVVSITKGPRQTNFELLRLFAMFLVLIFHSDFLCTGYPNKSNLDESMVQTITKIFIESSSVVCVNIFVLISGWFGIKPTIKGLLNFIFQCVYFLTLTYLITCLLGINKVSLHGIKSCIFLLPESNWFIRAYIALYIISPILNVYLEKCNKKQLGTVLILFFAFQTIFGITNISIFISWGYSTFSFIGLYLLAQYAKRYILANYAWGGYIYYVLY